MIRQTDISVEGVRLYFLPVRTRLPLKFGSETLTSVTCARVCMKVRNREGSRAEGWGETPLSVQWVWPGALPYATRHQALEEFTRLLVTAWAGFDPEGHAMELGHRFQETRLQQMLSGFNAARPAGEAMPWLAALVCCAAFDIALHDAYGNVNQRPVYETYNARFMNLDLGSYLEPAAGTGVNFDRKHPSDYLVETPPKQLKAWHLVGGLDALSASELTSAPPDDGHPSVLPDWIDRDGLTCLKVKLRGNDWQWDYDRLVRVAGIGLERKVDWLSADYNCTVTDPAYVTSALDRLREEHPRIYGMILYVEQPFPYELEEARIDVHAVSARKPLFLDESAHDWRMVRLGRELGWTGVALKTCKTQTGALLSCCWARAHGMELMVQDLTNPMLAQIPHLLLAAHAGTIMGVETNAMQFYPAASDREMRIHPGLYRRRNGMVDLSTLGGPGFGYRLDEIARSLPPEAAAAGNL